MADKNAPLIKRGGNNTDRQVAIALVWLLEEVKILKEKVEALENPHPAPSDED